MKSLFRSKTFWVNLAAGLMYLGHRVGVPEVPPIDPGLLALINIGLRLLTKSAVRIL